MGWTEDRVDVLKKLWLEGLSASQIAKQLGGGVTRNAVIGKVHRLGLSGRAAPSKPTRIIVRPPRPRPAVSVSQPRRVETHSAPVVRAYVRDEAPGSATVLTLNARSCRWPIGDPSNGDFTFCGQGAAHGPYCEHHAAVAYQAPQKKTKRADIADLARSLRRYM